MNPPSQKTNPPPISCQIDIFIGRIHLHNWRIHFFIRRIHIFLGVLTILNESAMTCTWIRPKMKWIQHQIYLSTTLFYESASFISRGFKLKRAWLLEIVREFIFWWENNTLFRCVLVLLSTDILSCGVVSGCALCCVVLFSVVLSALSGLVVLPLPQMFRTTTYHLLSTLYLDIVLLL